MRKRLESDRTPCTTLAARLAQSSAHIAALSTQQNFRPDRNEPIFGARVAGGEPQGQLTAESKQTVITVEHHAATSKDVRARALYRDLRT